MVDEKKKNLKSRLSNSDFKLIEDAFLFSLKIWDAERLLNSKLIQLGSGFVWSRSKTISADEFISGGYASMIQDEILGFAKKEYEGVECLKEPLAELDKKLSMVVDLVDGYKTQH